MTKHVHAELMMQYAQDAMETDKPWERWQYKKNYGEWEDLTAQTLWNPQREYRHKPKTRTVNGFTFEWEPATDPNCYYYPNVTKDDLYFSSFNRSRFEKLLQIGVATKTPEMAIAHAKAMLGIDPNGD